MAKKPSSRGGATSRKAPTPKRKQAVRAKPARKSSSESDFNAAEALSKFIESPLVAELLAVGATAALAAVASTGFSRTADGRRSTRMLKAAAKAAAGAMGQRLATEFTEIRNASRSAKERAKA